MTFTKPMQPCNADLSKIKFPALAQKKIDGMKLVIKLRQGTIEVLSRSMKPIANKWLVDEVKNMFEPAAFLNLTIEAEAQNGDMFKNSKGLVSAANRKFFELKIHMFDAITENKPMEYWDRYAVLDAVASMITDGRVEIVSSIKVYNHQELSTVCNINSQDLSLDGTIVRQADSPYKAGKRTAKEGYVVKIKNQADMEVTVVGFVELMHNQNEGKTNELGRTARSTAKDGLVPGGTLGSFLCKTVDGKDVRVGSLEGVTKQERQAMWDRRTELAGKLLKIKYMELSEYGVPLHPVFLGFRDLIDLD